MRIDIRGTGASTGIIEDEYVPRGRRTRLRFSAGWKTRNGAAGNSACGACVLGGFSSLQTAMLRPPQLRAIAPVHATHDRFACDVHYTGGSLHAQEQVDWPPSMVVCNGLPPTRTSSGMIGTSDGWKGWRTPPNGLGFGSAINVATNTGCTALHAPTTRPFNVPRCSLVAGSTGMSTGYWPWPSTSPAPPGPSSGRGAIPTRDRAPRADAGSSRSPRPVVWPSSQR